MSAEELPREVGVKVNQCGGVKTLIGIKLDEIMTLAQMQDGRALDRVREEIHGLVDRFCDETVAIQVLIRKHLSIDP